MRRTVLSDMCEWALVIGYALLQLLPIIVLIVIILVAGGGWRPRRSRLDRPA